MTKKYTREENINERLEQENRQLKQQVRFLSKRLKKTTRGFYKVQNEDNTDEKENIIEEAIKEIEKICWTCKVGVLAKVELLGRYWRKCGNCDYRTKAKPSKKASKS